MNSEKKLLTTGEIAERLGCQLWRVQYLLASRGIKPDQRVGHFRIYDSSIVDVLQNEIKKMTRRIDRNVIC